MKSLRLSARPLIAFLGCALVAGMSIGCQTQIAGQTLPSAYYLRDDIQYYQAGPEDQLTNQREAIKQYNLQRQGLQELEESAEAEAR